MATIFLYVKQHNITGLKYFGKTVRNPYSYPGSGVVWKRHYRKHGKEHIKTTDIWQFDDYDVAKTFAIEFSNNNNIVESNEWANLMIEQLDGGDTSHSINYLNAMLNRPSRKGIPHRKETIAKMRKPKPNKESYKHLIPPSHKGRIYINNGVDELRVYSEHLEQYKANGFVKGKLKIQCICGTWADKQNLKRHHSKCYSHGK